MIRAHVLPLAAAFLLACGNVAPTATVDPRPTQTRVAEISERATLTAPTPTAAATSTPVPTATSEATATAAATSTPTPLSASTYLTESNDALQLLIGYVQTISSTCAYKDLMTCVSMYHDLDPLYRQQVSRAKALQPPLQCKQVHYSVLSVIVRTDEFMNDMGTATSQRSPAKIQTALFTKFAPISDALKVLNTTIKQGDCR